MTNEQLIMLSKKMSEIIKQANKNIRISGCMICNKKLTSSCRSHNIPRMILKQLTLEDNKIYNVSNVYAEITGIKIDYNKPTGNNGTQIFRRICRECDSKIFQSIENQESFLNPYSKEQLNLIMLKQYLYELDNKLLRQERNILAAKSVNSSPIEFDINHDYLKYDIQSLINHNIKPILDSNYSTTNRIVFDEILNYNVKVAMNHFVSPRFDSKGKINFNNMSEKNLDKDIGYINIGIFPLHENKTRVIVFYKRSYDFRFTYVKNDLEKLGSINEKLKYINDLIVMYNDNYVFSKDILTNLIEYERLLKTDFITIVKEEHYIKLAKLTENLNIFKISSNI